MGLKMTYGNIGHFISLSMYWLTRSILSIIPVIDTPWHGRQDGFLGACWRGIGGWWIQMMINRSIEGYHAKEILFTIHLRNWFATNEFGTRQSLAKWVPLIPFKQHINHSYVHWFHYSDGIMSAIASQITGVSIVCSIVCSGAYQRKQQSAGIRAMSNTAPSRADPESYHAKEILFTIQLPKYEILLVLGPIYLVTTRGLIQY